MLNKTIIAILAVVILEAVAIWRGIDGATLGIAIAAIAGLGGYEVRAWQSKKRQPPK